jgi:phosphatidylinositol-3-phosphatase
VVLAALSLFATIVVLTQGVGASGEDLAVRAALRAPLTVTAAMPGGSTPASDGADATDDAADDGGTVDTAASDTGSGGGTGDVADDTNAGADDDAGSDTEATPPSDAPTPSKIEHVFVISLAGHGFDAAFGPASSAPYLSQQLRPQGALLTNYRSLGRADLPDLIAQVGGQPPNDDTRAGCPSFKEIPPTSAPSKSGEVAAAGCVFPNTVTTIADQLSASRRSWRAYVEDLEKGPLGKATCRHPESNAADDTTKARLGDGYATRHNPFVYFHSLLDLGDCDSSDGALSQLETDLSAVKTTPSYSFIAPNLCNDGSESPCVDGSPGGLAAADAFLATWVPKILASPAYKADGLLIVTFAGSVAPESPTDPRGSAPATDSPAGSDEGALNGTLLVSRYAQAGSSAGADYDPYSLLRSIEDLFGLRPLARAAKARSFAETVLGNALTTPPSDG